ncbi:hypothetical protein Lalb_Chr20g0114521 [Lupinus albus]|uniref:Uncharacterized protein n=1 Tax=Lupinus albus TaxID=3870 RepID=A0A6A4NTR2_LUPAL|nr:hypothetical protein Lalb_Chr20g0114521 [Lupinus albus]
MSYYCDWSGTPLGTPDFHRLKVRDFFCFCLFYIFFISECNNHLQDMKTISRKNHPRT